MLLSGAFLLTLAVAAGRARGVRATPGARDADPAVPPTPGRCLRTALERRSALRGLRGAELEAARRTAFHALRDVSLRFARVPAVSAEAAFRAGEVARAAGWPDDARGAFERAVEKGVGTPFHQRGLLELGHLARRAGEAVEGLAYYDAVLLAPETTRVHADRAAIWRGRMQIELGRIAEARASWWRVARHGSSPLDRIRAHALIAGSWSAAGDPERACAVLERCRDDCEQQAAEISELGSRVRRALARLACE